MRISSVKQVRRKGRYKEASLSQRLSRATEGKRVCDLTDSDKGLEMYLMSVYLTENW